MALLGCITTNLHSISNPGAVKPLNPSCCTFCKPRQPLKLLTRKELLRLEAPLALAARTPQAHLRRARDPAPQMALGQVGQRLDKDGAAVQALDPLDRLGVPRLADDL